MIVPFFLVTLWYLSPFPKRGIFCTSYHQQHHFSDTFFLGFSMALGNSWHYVWPLHGGEVSSAALNNIHSQWQIFMSPSKKKLLKNILSSFTKVTLHWIHSFEKEGECIQRNVLSPNLSKLVGYQALWQIEFRRADFVYFKKERFTFNKKSNCH